MATNSIVLDQGETETVPLAVVAGPDDRRQRGRSSGVGVKDSWRERVECADADDGIAFKAVTKGH